MKVFVPRYRHNLPPVNGDILDAMFTEIDQRDLLPVINQWKLMDGLTGANAKTVFRIATKEACQYPTQKHKLEPFLRRPHITVHCGSKEGNDHVKQLAHDLMFETGRLVARNGFNFWYGGGENGLMGASLNGFLDEQKKYNYPDQYSVQVTTADFVVGVIPGSNGLKAVNEGLSSKTDVAIVLPDFVSRRELLDNKCAAAITGLGGSGSIDELFDILVHIKTGLRETHSYVLNPHIPLLGRGYWDPMRDMLANHAVACGFENPRTMDFIHFKESAQEAVDHLMAKLNAAGQNPCVVYAQNCARPEEAVAVPPAKWMQDLKVV